MTRTLAALAAFSTLALVAARPCPGRDEEHDAIKAVIEQETLAWIERDADRWQSAWLHDDQATRATINANAYNAAIGWDEFGPAMIEGLEANPQRLPYERSAENFLIRTDGSMAWVEFDQTLASTGGADGSSRSRERRVLVKRDGEWKIAVQITVAPDSFAQSLDSVAGRILRDGFFLMQEGKVGEAIELLKVQTRLRPDLWTGHYALGIAHERAGEKELAIEHLEKALELDPERPFVKDALDRLKGSSDPDEGGRD